MTSVANHASVGWLLAPAEAVPEGDRWLTSEERRAQARFAVAKRRADWRLGRWTAKQAIVAWLAAEGQQVRPGSVGVEARADDDGYPEVRGIAGAVPSLSLSHRDGIGLAVVGPAGTRVGCDLEQIEPRSARFPADWFTAFECGAVAAVDGVHRDEVVTLIWSAKESVLKAVGEGLRRDTRSVEVDVGHRAEALGERWTAVLATDLEGATAYRCWARRLGVHLAVVAVELGATATASPEPLVGGWAS